MDYGFVAYIDEAGAPGLDRVRPIDPIGATEWLCVSAVLIRAESEADVAGWVREIRTGIGVRQRPDLHFRSLSPARKLAVCERMAKMKDIRCFVVASNKKNMRGHQNQRAANAYSNTQQWFYNWCVRLIMERVTDYCEQDSLKRFREVKRVKIEFAKRGGHLYSQTAAYQDLLKAQARNDHVLLSRRVPKWRTMHASLFRAYEIHERAGLQLADVVASAFYTAADNLDTGLCAPSYAMALKPRMAEECGKARDYGVALQPWIPADAALTPDQQEIFRFYGYDAHEFIKRVAATGSRHRQ